MDSVEISISDVRKIVNRLLDHIERDRGIATVPISQNYYWELAPDVRFNMDTNPSEFEVGSLVDDWEFVSALLRDDSQPVSLQLAELAPILDFLGRTVGR